MQLIADGKAVKITQPEEGATYDAIWKKKKVAKVGLKPLFVMKYGITQTSQKKNV